jgi:hypothetical protein
MDFLGNMNKKTQMDQRLSKLDVVEENVETEQVKVWNYVQDSNV